MDNYKNVSQDIRDQLNAEAEAVQIILTGIDNDIYSTVDACHNTLQRRNSIEYASEMELECAKEDKDIEKVIDLENKVKVLENIVYKTGQSVQTMNILNNKCRTNFAKPEYLKKAKQANPRLYDI
nr:hypothetical protein [Tanacetum cinerariifolium]